MPKALSHNQICEYEQDGVVFPIKVLTDGELATARAAFETLTTALGERPDSRLLRHLHLFHRWARDLAQHPGVLDAVEDVIGPDILLHSSTVFCKRPRDPGYVSWHQDGFYSGLSDLQYTSAWLALTDSSPDNGCMRVVRGSHRAGIVAHNRASISPDNFVTMEIACRVEESEATDVYLAPGEMSLHHVAIVHGSNPNASDRHRIGYAVRYVSPGVRQKLDHYPVILARGHDRFGHYRLLEEPPSLSLQEAICAQQELLKWGAASRATEEQVPLPASIHLRWRDPGSPAA
ncbi:MAG TPA: phytanoyl-CoA dioxygenase family protein [Candidatus Angelobacter sp.]